MANLDKYIIIKIWKNIKFQNLQNYLMFPRTLRRWDKESKLIAYRTPSGDRFYTKEQYKIYMSTPLGNQVYKNAIHARVSNIGQKDDLNN